MDQSETDAILDRYEIATVAWPSPIDQATVDNDRLLDLFRGSLLWGAVGDAMGRPVEGMDASDILGRYPSGPDGYEPPRWWTDGPMGTITDDTQLTMVVADCLIEATGRFDGGDFARALVNWLPTGRGKGRATTEAIQRIVSGTHWSESGGRRAAGNGAAMRSAPIGLVHSLESTPANLLADAVLYSVPTHAHPVGVAAAAVVAAGAGSLVRWRLAGMDSLDPDTFAAFLAEVADAIAPDPITERRPSGLDVTLGGRLREAAELATDTAELFDRFWSGAFVIESLPCALHAFLLSPADPLRVLRTSLRAGHDVDTIASMAGNFAGAWAGAKALESTDGPWWDELETRGDLIALSDGLAAIAAV